MPLGERMLYAAGPCPARAYRAPPPTLHPALRLRLTFCTGFRFVEPLLSELVQFRHLQLVDLALREMRASEDRRAGCAEMYAHRLDVVDWVEVAQVYALVDEADPPCGASRYVPLSMRLILHAARRWRLALQREAHHDRPVGVEDLVCHSPVDLEDLLVPGKLLLVYYEWEGPKLHRIGGAGELVLDHVDRLEPRPRRWRR